MWRQLLLGTASAGLARLARQSLGMVSIDHIRQSSKLGISVVNCCNCSLSVDVAGAFLFLEQSVVLVAKVYPQELMANMLNVSKSVVCC